MGAPPKANWLAVRTYYVAGHTVAECSQKFGVSTRQIERRIASEGWPEKRRRNVAEASEIVAKQITADTIDELLDHEDFVRWAAGVAKGIDADLAETKAGRSRAEIRRIGIEAAERVVRMSRLVRGIADGRPSGKPEQQDDGIVFTVDADALEEAQKLA